MELSPSQLLSHSMGKRVVAATAFCAISSLSLIYWVSVTRSLVITGTAWTTVFSFFCLISTLLSISNVTYSSSKRHTFGFARAPVLAAFSTTVLAQLSSVFLTKEAIERLLESGHHHGSSAADNSYLYAAALMNALSLLAAAYAVTNQPINYVLVAAQSSLIQEYAADISRAICHFVPGLSCLLLPRLNSLTLLAFVSTACCTLTHFFMNDFWWFDAVAALVLSATVFGTMMPLSAYTGRILLQTTPPHIHNQIDRCISEASTVEGVLELRNAHFWQLDFSSIAGTIDVRIRRDANEQVVLGLVTEKLSNIVSNITVQVLKDITTTWGNNSSIASVHNHHYSQPSGFGVNSAHTNLMSPHHAFFQPTLSTNMPAHQWQTPAAAATLAYDHTGHSHSHDHTGHGHSHNYHEGGHDHRGHSHY